MTLLRVGHIEATEEDHGTDLEKILTVPTIFSEK